MSRPTPKLGRASVDKLVINTVVPLLLCYGKLRRDAFYEAYALDLLKRLPPESNQQTRWWVAQGWPCQSAFDSQALLALSQHYKERLPPGSK